MLEPPDPMPNSEVKRHIADGSVGLPHVRVGHRQALKYKKGPLAQYARGLFLYLIRCAHPLGQPEKRLFDFASEARGYAELFSIPRGEAAIPSSGTEV